MSRTLWLVLGAFLALFPWFILEAAVVELEHEVPAETSEDEVRHHLYRLSVERLIKQEMGRMNLDVKVYEDAFDKKFQPFFSEIQARKSIEWQKAGLSPETVIAETAKTKEKSRFVFSGWENLLKRYTIKKFQPHAEKIGVWLMTFDAEVDEGALSLNFARLTSADQKPFRKLFVYSQLRPDNFSWEDLKLTSALDFIRPVELEWLKWFKENQPAEVEEVVLCDESCQGQIAEWRALDEKAMAQFVSPELIGGLLLTVNINFSRETLLGPVSESKVTYTGGVILQDLNTKRVLHYADLPTEIQTLKLNDQKQFNSAMASHTYRYPLEKFLLAKTQVGKSVSLSNSMVVRLVNPLHLGQAMRLIEWIQQKGAPMQAQGKLDSFSRKEARLLVFFKGEGTKFKTLVEKPFELELEWNRPLTVESSTSDLSFTVGEKKQ